MRLLVLAVLISACGLAPAPRAAPDAASVTRVIDGDSLLLQVDGQSVEVRLLGINAPEHDECIGPEAALHLATLIGDEPMTVSFDGQDQYGRSLGEVFASGASVNASMVADGFALAMSTPGFAHFFDLEADAAKSGAGLWAESICGAAGPRPAVSIVAMDANPPGPDKDALDQETITLANRGATAIDLSNWVVRDESTANRLHLPAGTVLAPGERLTISSGCGTSTEIVYWCARGPIWNNSGDTALLLDAFGRIVSTLHKG